MTRADRADVSLSVVMPVHNAMPYLNDAIASIVGQTHDAFEFVIGDDGSNDGSSELLADWAARDRRIRLLRRDGASGPAGSANWVVRAARGTIVARMDADDISCPERLAKECRVLAEYPDAAMTACLSLGIDRRGRVVKERERHLLAGSGLGAPFSHGSIMFRRAAFEAVGGYRAQCQFWEDLDFIARIGGVGRILVLPDALYHYRFSETSTRLTSDDVRVEAAVAQLLRCGDAISAGQDYEPLIEKAGGDGRRRVSPRVFMSIASGRVGAGQPAGMIGRILRRGALPRTKPDMVALAYAIWGSVAPRSLRSLLIRRAAARDLAAASEIRDGNPVEWRPRRPRSDVS